MQKLASLRSGRASKNIAFDKFLAKTLFEEGEDDLENERDRDVADNAETRQAEKRPLVQNIRQRVVKERAHHDDQNPLNRIQNLLRKAPLAATDDSNPDHNNGQEINPADREGCKEACDRVQN